MRHVTLAITIRLAPRGDVMHAVAIQRKFKFSINFAHCLFESNSSNAAIVE